MLIYLSLPFFLFISSFVYSDNIPAKILVSVAPYRYFVKQIAQDLVEVNLMVPEASSAHTFEPSPKQMIEASQAEIWFRIGEPFENKAIDAIKNVQPNLEVIDLRNGLNLLHGQCKHVHTNGNCGDDLHLWMSPKIAKIQAQTIAAALIKHFPQHNQVFEKNLKTFIADLTLLDAFIYKTLESVKNRILLVSHPAYAYFCETYHFNQISIEFEGRDPTAKQLTQLLNDAKNSNVNFILTQPQYSDKAAKLIAEQVKARLISVDPYSEDYEVTLRSIAKIIAENQ